MAHTSELILGEAEGIVNILYSYEKGYGDEAIPRCSAWHA